MISDRFDFRRSDWRVPIRRQFGQAIGHLIDVEASDWLLHAVSDAAAPYRASSFFFYFCFIYFYFRDSPCSGRSSVITLPTKQTAKELGRDRMERSARFLPLPLLLITLITTVNALYGPSTPVLQLNPSNFKSKVSIFIQFHFCRSVSIFIIFFSMQFATNWCCLHSIATTFRCWILMA